MSVNWSLAEQQDLTAGDGCKAGGMAGGRQAFQQLVISDPLPSRIHGRNGQSPCEVRFIANTDNRHERKLMRRGLDRLL